MHPQLNRARKRESESINTVLLCNRKVAKMTLGTKIDELIGLLKLSWKWSSRFSHCQYAVVLIILLLLKISVTLLLIASETIGEITETYAIVTAISAVFLLLGSIVFNWLIFLTGIGATVRRFHDIDVSGWYTLLLIVPLINILVIIYLLLKKGKGIEITRWG